MRHLLLHCILLLFIVNVKAQVNNKYHYVEGYYRNDGTYVRGHYRTNPNETINDNYTTKHNINPWTGKVGHLQPEKGIINRNRFFIDENLRRKINTEQAFFYYKNGDYEKSLEYCFDAIQNNENLEVINDLIYNNLFGLNLYKSAFLFANEVYINTQDNEYLARVYVSSLFESNVNSDSVKESIYLAGYWNENDIYEELLFAVLNNGLVNNEVCIALSKRLNLLLETSLLDMMIVCNGCEVDYISNKIAFLHGNSNSILLNIDSPAGTNILGVTLELPFYEYSLSRINILQQTDFREVGIIPVPLLVKVESDNLNNTIDGVVYLDESDNGAVFHAGDISGEKLTTVGTITFRR